MRWEIGSQKDFFSWMFESHGEKNEARKEKWIKKKLKKDRGDYMGHVCVSFLF